MSSRQDCKVLKPKVGQKFRQMGTKIIIIFSSLGKLKVIYVELTLLNPNMATKMITHLI